MDGIHDMGGTAGLGHGDDPARRARLRRAVGGEGVRFRCPLRPAVRPESRRHAPRHRPPAPPRLPRRRVLRPVARRASRRCSWTVACSPRGGGARARKLRGEEVDEPADPEPNKPDYQPTAAGSIRQIDAKPRLPPGDRVRTKPQAHAGHTRDSPLHPAHTGNVVAVRPAQVLPDTTPTSSPRTPSTSTPSPSTPRSCGVTTPSPSRSRSTCTTTTWSRSR